MTTCVRKARRGRDSSALSFSIRNSTHAPWIATSTIQRNGSHQHFFIRIPRLGHVLVHSAEKTNVLVVTVELNQLLFSNILFFNFIPTPNKSLRFKRFRRSYLNRTVAVLTNHSQSYTAFLLDARCSKWPCSLFFRCLSRMIVHLRNLFLLNTRATQIFLTPRWVSRQKDVTKIVIHKYFKTNNWSWAFHQQQNKIFS